MGLTGVFIFTLPVAIASVLLCNRINRYQKDDLAAHLKEFPWSPAASVPSGRSYREC
jgi:hypothetical protein